MFRRHYGQGTSTNQQINKEVHFIAPNEQGLAKNIEPWEIGLLEQPHTLIPDI
jgi:hypothetical protein